MSAVVLSQNVHVSVLLSYANVKTPGHEDSPALKLLEVRGSGYSCTRMEEGCRYGASSLQIVRNC